MKQAFSWKNLDYPIILCPPMDGVTDMAYRELVSDMGGSAALYCEFINVKGVLFDNPKTIFELAYTEKQRPIIAQLFGHEPMEFYEAAKKVVRMGFDAIDINMGCPAHKVNAHGGGCSLMGDPENAANIVKMTIKGANESWHEMGNEGDYEVTCKMRLGISEKDTVHIHAKAMIDAGAKCVAIHGRTLKQMYTGEADWAPAREFKKEIGDRARIFGSGDVKSLYEAFVRILTTGVDGVMIGRGSFGNPWVFDKNKVALMKKYLIDVQAEYGKKSGEFTLEEVDSLPTIEEIKVALANVAPTFEELKNAAIKHAMLMVDDKGEKGMVQMRKHLGWYFGGFEGAKQLRSDLVRVNTIEEMRTILDNFKMPITPVEAVL
jgi:tRNA-dihydrouridine synthase B